MKKFASVIINAVATFFCGSVRLGLGLDDQKAATIMKLANSTTLDSDQAQRTTSQRRAEI